MHRAPGSSRTRWRTAVYRFSEGARGASTIHREEHQLPVYAGDWLVASLLDVGI